MTKTKFQRGAEGRGGGTSSAPAAAGGPTPPGRAKLAPNAFLKQPGSPHGSPGMPPLEGVPPLEGGGAAGPAGRALPEGFRQMPNMIKLARLDEDSIMDNIYARFTRDEIYTYVGSVLLSMNPFQIIDGLYSPEVVNRFMQRGGQGLPPHVSRSPTARTVPW